MQADFAPRDLVTEEISVSLGGDEMVWLWHSGLDAEDVVIVELALADVDGADYQVWTCDG